MEQWKPVVGYEGRYEVSNFGNIRTSVSSPHKNARIHLGKIISKRLLSGGYFHVSLNLNGNKSTRTVHSIVLEAFKGPRPQGKVARHLDGNRKNNSEENLEWSTQKENLRDRIQHGTDFKGERHPNHVLTDRDVIAIRDMKQRGYTNVFISNCFMVTPANIGHVVNGKSWTHV